ncbi:uncharacterized protein STEHIDRAFT_118689 [Stereum hirsutum FP-91666 SS1]|uniref:uncharacterized protein n=1 Tax=Stereum hirsutum (strain FP-91666) TaxID=721885 RepID=UPI000440A224|nr:uncharacterized protein STEHIDRAFT_118689 [Stereum hirsutum FP-91666 SS1]EIM89464.1 hypothetical protein STEHIDRAFT_118689 [Stereum hirsutum FP-91666 SS1]
MVISLGQATVYALTGLHRQSRDIGAGVCLLLIIQLVAAALIVILIDKLLQKERGPSSLHGHQHLRVGRLNGPLTHNHPHRPRSRI